MSESAPLLPWQRMSKSVLQLLHADPWVKDDEPPIRLNVHSRAIWVACGTSVDPVEFRGRGAGLRRAEELQGLRLVHNAPMLTGREPPRFVNQHPSLKADAGGRALSLGPLFASAVPPATREEEAQMRSIAKQASATGIILLVVGLFNGVYRLKKAPAKKRGRAARRARIATFAAAYNEAASDPAFLEDMRRVDSDFDAAASDGLMHSVMA